jgi:hypothetical protein
MIMYNKKAKMYNKPKPIKSMSLSTLKPTKQVVERISDKDYIWVPSNDDFQKKDYLSKASEQLHSALMEAYPDQDVEFEGVAFNKKNELMAKIGKRWIPASQLNLGE